METRNYKILRAIFTVIICLSFAIALTMTILVFTYDDPSEVPYFIDHFGVGLALALVGMSAILMTILNKYNINSSDKGDKLMQLVGLLLIIFGIGTTIFSYL